MICWPKSLISDLARRRSVLFLGSGISKNAKNAAGLHPKDWGEFLQEGASKVSSSSKKALITKCIKNGDYLLACELLKKIMGRDDFVHLLKDEFLTPKFENAKIHEDIFLLDSRIVITPNFDKIYDVYADKESKGSIIIKNYYDDDIADHIRQRERLILKIHGSITTPDKLIFSRTDYSEARISYKHFYSILEALIATHTFIFLGAGLNDPDIKLLLEDYSFRYQNSQKHLFILPKQSLDREILKIHEENMNLKIITYDNKNNHQELLDSIGYLVKLVDAERQTLAKTYDW